MRTKYQINSKEKRMETQMTCKDRSQKIAQTLHKTLVEEKKQLHSI